MPAAAAVGKKGKRKKKPSRTKENKLKREVVSEAEEQERLRKWEECWERKIQAQEERDYAKCCAAKGLCTKPRTQSNIWINVTQDRSIQEINIAIKHVPVPKPKPPPLPPLKPQNPPENAVRKKDVGKKVHKNVGTGKKKRK